MASSHSTVYGGVHAPQPHILATEMLRNRHHLHVSVHDTVFDVAKVNDGEGSAGEYARKVCYACRIVIVCNKSSVDNAECRMS